MSLAPNVASAVDQVPGWRSGQVSVVSSLGGGPTSETLLIERRALRYVLRIDTPVARRLGLDRAAELEAYQAAADAGIAPPVEYASPHDGVQVTRYVEGRAWQSADINDGENLARLAALLPALHSLSPAVRKFDLPAAMQRYARQIGSDDAFTLAREGESLLAQVGRRDSALCHNDLVARNIVEGDRLWLIDFEYAALGDPLFDLAVVVAHHDLNETSQDAFLAAYAADDWEVARESLRIYTQVYQRLLALWRRVA